MLRISALASSASSCRFLTEADLQYLKPLVEDDLAQVETLLGVRDGDGQVVGFSGVDGDEVAASAQMIWVERRTGHSASPTKATTLAYQTNCIGQIVALPRPNTVVRKTSSGSWSTG
jgi:acyl-CoA thioesterase FadM